MKRTVAVIWMGLVFCSAVVHRADSAEWTRFRGPDGSGVSSDTGLPTTWSDSKNLKWKTELPGAGASSPIISGDRIFVTCYSGYGVAGADGKPEDLKRHLVCVNRDTGKILWSKTVDASQPEDSYRGMGVPEHGYASNTPVTDGENVYVFFGKSGVLAFDFDGNQLWQVDVGKESSRMEWGSAASLILYKDFVIVNASEESQSIRALDKKTGEEAWKSEAASLELVYSTPLLVTADGRTDLVIAVPNEVWGLNPDTGKLQWYAETSFGGTISPSVISQGDVAYLFGGNRPQGSVAVRAGGNKDVTESHIVWSSRNGSYITTPVLHDGHFYWVDERGMAQCTSAENGESVYTERMPLSGGGGRPFYASVVLADGKIYAVSRQDGIFVLAAQPEFELLAQNRFDADESEFNATPAISDGSLILRSDRFLYCVDGD